MSAGERFITDKHMVGNRGMDLTPSAALILSAKAAGMLVAMDPTCQKPLYFRAHPSKPAPAKLPVRARDVPACVTAAL